MALVLHNVSGPNLGQFDGYVTETLNFKGGEICTLVQQPYPAADAASDVNTDGYINAGGFGRVIPGVSRTLLTTATRPLFLSDDGTTNYGTLFGSVVGGTAGRQVTGGAQLGPHTAAGSGKITLWDKQGLYGVTLDACDTASDGLVPTNTALRVGSSLTYVPGGASGGQLTPVGSTAAGGNTVVVGRLASFETNGSLVTTPQSLVAALNSPSGDVSSLTQQTFYQAVFWFSGAQSGG